MNHDQPQQSGTPDFDPLAWEPDPQPDADAPASTSEIRRCRTCGNAFPDFTASSFLNCHDCRRKDGDGKASHTTAMRPAGGTPMYDPPPPDLSLVEQVKHARGFASGICRNDHHVARLLEQMARSIEQLSAQAASAQPPSPQPPIEGKTPDICPKCGYGMGPAGCWCNVPSPPIEGKTPGQVAYEAWSKALEERARSFGLSWDEMGEINGHDAHAVWEAAAQAVAGPLREQLAQLKEDAQHAEAYAYENAMERFKADGIEFHETNADGEPDGEPRKIVYCTDSGDSSVGIGASAWWQTEKQHPLREKIDELEVTLDDEEAAHQETPRQLATLQAELDRFRRMVSCMVRGAINLTFRRDRNYPHPLDGPPWARVAHLCGLDGTSAAALCREFGVDPHTGDSGTATGEHELDAAELASVRGEGKST